MDHIMDPDSINQAICSAWPWRKWTTWTSEEEEEEDSETWIKMEGKPTVKSTKFEEEIIGLVGNLKPERVCEMMGQRWTQHGFW